MTTGEIIALVAAGGVLGLLWWRRQQAATPAGPDTCDTLCKDAGQDNDICRAACRAGGAVLGAINPLHDSVQQETDERRRRQAVNDQLNGSARVQNPWPVSAASVLGSTVLEYDNGCQPFYGAPGFSKCEAGTLDMYGSAVTQGAGVDSEQALHEGDLLTEPAFLTVAARQASEAQRTANGGDPMRGVPTTGANRGARLEPLSKAHFMTGQSADPTTIGPFDDGSWYVRGQKCSCPNGQAPKAVVLQNFGDIAAGSDEDAQMCVDAFTDPRAVHTFTGTCPPPAGFSYELNAAGQWALVRMHAGDTQNLGPCASSSSSSKARVTEHL